MGKTTTKKPSAEEAANAEAAVATAEGEKPAGSNTPSQDQAQDETGARPSEEAAGAPEVVRCKFRVKEKRRRCAAGGNIFTDLEMEPVQPKRNDAQKLIPSANDDVWDIAPGGSVMLFAVKEDPSMFFEVGEEYFLDFTRATEMPPA